MCTATSTWLVAALPVGPAGPARTVGRPCNSFDYLGHFKNVVDDDDDDIAVCTSKTATYVGWRLELHRMLTVVTDVRGVCLSVCLSRSPTRLRCVKTAEQIKILFVMNTLGGPKNIVLDGDPDPPQ